ncbi:hypothetical protein K469DRAFT_756631 [Zopfia rhizophila CBS 207.26]|uniref:Uncharacterized protein n=1 Tax=Zopfia rhizophila CBS 207.26 TaxID=1314779 RepID=A0A6A6D6C9_9PEZI|nr:hypothetical protein K469DRAFT_756631 [Zopfia rhizophila CBS 207.26]
MRVDKDQCMKKHHDEKYCMEHQCSAVTSWCEGCLPVDYYKDVPKFAARVEATDDAVGVEDHTETSVEKHGWRENPSTAAEGCRTEVCHIGSCALCGSCKKRSEEIEARAQPAVEAAAEAAIEVTPSPTGPSGCLVTMIASGSKRTLVNVCLLPAPAHPCTLGAPPVRYAKDQQVRNNRQLMPEAKSMSMLESKHVWRCPSKLRQRYQRRNLRKVKPNKIVVPSVISDVPEEEALPSSSLHRLEDPIEHSVQIEDFTGERASALGHERARDEMLAPGKSSA